MEKDFILPKVYFEAIKFTNKDRDQWTEASVTRRGGKVKGWEVKGSTVNVSKLRTSEMVLHHV